MNEIVPGIIVDSWQAFLVPAGVPQEILDVLHSEITKVLQLPAVQSFFREQAFVGAAGHPDALGAVLRAEIPKWRRVIQETGLRIN